MSVAPQYEILQSLYLATGGDNWINNRGWADPYTNVCEWHGITCDGNGDVSGIDLGSNGLVGEIPETIYSLPSLVRVVLNDNAVDISFDNIATAGFLQDLDLSGTRVSSASGISNAAALKDLNVSNTSLTSFTISDIFNVSSLLSLDISTNRLRGTLSDSLGQLINLNIFSCRESFILGTIPRAIKELSKLTFFDMSRNRLSGTISSEIMSLQQLSVFNVATNRISGTIPSELGNLSQLSFLDLSENIISGTVPTELGVLPDLSILDLSGNFLSGIIPLFDGNSFPQLESLQLSDNMFTGPIPTTVGRFSNLAYLDLSANALSGTIPSQLGQAQSLSHLDLSMNKFTGIIPEDIGQPALAYLDLSETNLFGTIPMFVNELPEFQVLNLRSITLIGSITPDFLTGIVDKSLPIDIDLSNNQLTGTIPARLDAFDALNIDLTGNLMSGIPSNLCLKGGWMDGDVAMFACDAILCPPSTFNSFGRQVSSSLPCMRCESSTFFGHKHCDQPINLSPTPEPSTDYVYEYTRFPRRTPEPSSPTQDPTDYIYTRFPRRTPEPSYYSLYPTPTQEPTDFWWWNPTPQPSSYMGGGFDNSSTSSYVQIHVPFALFKPGGYNHMSSLFGVFPIGSSIRSNLFYADSDLCDRNVDTRKGYPIRPLDRTGEMMPWPAPFILMVDRGNCTFVTKVRHAQQSGAAAVVIANNLCQCADGASCYDPENFCESKGPIMADDGSGSDISIPSVMMFKQDADVIKAELRENNSILMELSWPVPKPGDRVKYEVWTTPTDTVGLNFLLSFEEFALALGDSAHFTPHMYIFDGIGAGCRSDSGENMCFNLCTNSGRYCATDPDNDLESGISGADVVIESLRRLCIWQLYGQGDGIGREWWSYVNGFNELCSSPEMFSEMECIYGVLKMSGIKIEEVEQCVEVDSGGWESEMRNKLLETEVAVAQRQGVNIIPTAFVDGRRIQGSLSASNMLAAICSGLMVGTLPDICFSSVTPGPSPYFYPTPEPTSYFPPFCSLDCWNGGTCIIFGNMERCACPDGFVGEFCEQEFFSGAVEICPDGHRCENEGLCVEVPNTMGSYYCNCTASGDSVAGLYCEYKATSFCGQNPSSFCTNNGLCEMREPGLQAGCSCPVGYEGEHCQFIMGTTPVGWPYDAVPDSLVETCPDGLVCENGSLCTQNPFRESTYYCDCSMTELDSSFAGISCEHEATVYCSVTFSRDSFCTNGGLCLSLTDENEAHAGCACLPEFEGYHCEFARGMAPDDWIDGNTTQSVGDPAMCPDNEMSCLHGGQCIESPIMAGEYFCDCATAIDGDVPYSGLNCEYPASSLCNSEPPFTSFCTNGGACISVVPQGQVHAGCRCLEGFEGSFCQLSTEQETDPFGLSDDDISSAMSTVYEPWKHAHTIVEALVAFAGLLGFL